MQYLRSLALGLVILCLAGTARAQADFDGPNTTMLSTGSLLKLRDVTQRLATLAQAQPALARRIPTIPGPDDKLDAAVEQVKSTPPVLEALQQTGLEPKPWLQDLASFAQALTARELQRHAGQIITPGMVQLNIRTLAQNRGLTRDIVRNLERLSLLQQRQGG